MTEPAAGKSPPRISALVALTLLEVIRYQDAPTEVLESEDPSYTMPRRLGLSDVIDRQIRRYREEAHSGGRVSDDEFRDLVRLVIRRPDSEDVFYHAGSILAAGRPSSRMARRAAALLGLQLGPEAGAQTSGQAVRAAVGGFAAGPFTLEARTHLFVDGDPGGDACHFMTGFCQAVLQRYRGRRARVVHSLCESRQDVLCRWTVLAEERVPDEAHRLIFNPEPGQVKGIAMVEKGSLAPDFTLLADDGTEVSLSDFRGKKVVLYFYPRDNTPGCTTQACDLRDEAATLAEMGVLVLGVSPDSVASHVRFRKKFNLNFPLLADVDHKVAEAYGVWREKVNFGVRALGIVRSSFLIDETGRVIDLWRKVKAAEHAGWVVERFGT